jgi:hypothetical protein
MCKMLKITDKYITKYDKIYCGVKGITKIYVLEKPGLSFQIEYIQFNSLF